MRCVTILAAATALAVLGGASARPTPYAACGVVCGDFLPSWSPDGRTIAFVHYVHGQSGPRETIYAVPADGGRERAVVDLSAVRAGGPSGPFSGLSWSPDSTLLDVVAGGANWIVPASGGTAHLLYGFDAAWSPDSRQLAVGAMTDIGGYRSPQFVPGEVRIAAVDGSGSRGIAGSDPSIRGGVWASNPVWSSENEIAYVTGQRQPGTQLPDSRTTEIWASRPDGSDAHRLVAASGSTYRLLAWSGDGRQLYFIASGQYFGTVDSIGEAGGTAAQLYTFSTADGCCELSPDAMRLVTTGSTGPGRVDVVVVDLASGKQTVVVKSIWPLAADVAWSPTADRLAFASGGQCGPLSGIQTIAAAGGRTTRLTYRCRRDGTAGPNVMRGGIGPEALYGHAGNDMLLGGDGPDFLQGGPGNDVVHGGPGDDRIYGGSGSDVLWGDAGNDTIWSRDRSRDVVHCGTGRDTVYADRHDVVAPDCEVLYRG